MKPLFAFLMVLSFFLPPSLSLAQEDPEALEELGAAFGRIFMLNYSSSKMEDALKAAKDVDGSGDLLNFWQAQAKAMGRMNLLKGKGAYFLDASGRSDNPVEVSQQRDSVELALGKTYGKEAVVSPNWVSSLLLRKLFYLSEFEKSGRPDQEKEKAIRASAYRAQAIYLLAAQQAKKSSDARISELLKAYSSGPSGKDWLAYIEKSEKQPYEPGKMIDNEWAENLADFLGAMRNAGYPVVSK